MTRAICAMTIGAAPLLGVPLAHGQGPAETTPPLNPRPVHAGEVHAAPYLDREGGPRNAGVLVGTSELSNIIDASERVHFELDEDVYITLPKGVTATVGQKFYTYELAEDYGQHGQVVIPTGVLSVERVGNDHEATTARIVQLFQKLSAGQGVLPLSDSAIESISNNTPTPVSDGAKAKVVWIENESVAPTVQFYVILSAGTKENVHVGDEFTLYRPALPDPEHHTVLPAAEIARVRVMRVNGYGSSAIIVKQDQPAIALGTAARLTAQMP